MTKENKMYSLIAVLMVLSLVGSLILVEQALTINLVAVFLFDVGCSAVLLYCLMRLGVMEFQQGTFWDRLNQRVNQRATQRATRTAAGRQSVRQSSTRSNRVYSLEAPTVQKSISYRTIA